MISLEGNEGGEIRGGKATANKKEHPPDGYSCLQLQVFLLPAIGHLKTGNPVSSVTKAAVKTSSARMLAFAFNLKATE